MIVRALQRQTPLTLGLRSSFARWDWQLIPKPYNIPMTKKEKRILYNPKNNPFPKYVTNLNDTLLMPGLTQDNMISLYEEFITNKDTPLSSQYVALLIYNFAKGGYLNASTWPRLETYIARNRGEFSLRSIFGCLYGCIRYGREEYIQFFVEEMKGQNLSFSEIEAIEIIEAFNLSKHEYSQQLKFNFWDTYFKPHYKSIITPQVRIHKFSTAMRIFDAFDKFEYYHDEQIWNTILSWLQRRRGWKRTQIIEKLYPLTGTFPKAKEIFDIYYAELSTNKHVQWRYNLEELRLYSSQEMIAKSQENIRMRPFDRTLVDRKDQHQMNREYHEWLKDGARQKEAELVKDKAQSLAYAIKNRYESMKKDKVDFTKLTVQQFEDLFGTYDKSMMYQGGDEEEQLGEDLFAELKGLQQAMQDQEGAEKPQE